MVGDARAYFGPSLRYFATDCTTGGSAVTLNVGSRLLATAIEATVEEDYLYRVPKQWKQRDIYDGWGVEERTTPAQRLALSSLQPPDDCALYAMAGEARMESMEPEEPYAKRPEQPDEKGIEY